MFGKYMNCSVITSGFHSIIECTGLFHGPDKQGGSQSTEGFAGCFEILVSQTGILGGGDGRRDCRQYKNKAVDQKHQFNQDGRTLEFPQFIQNICHWCIQRKKIQTGYAGKCGENQLYSMGKSLEASGDIITAD